MEKIVILSNFNKMFYVSLFIYYIYIKSIEYRDNKFQRIIMMLVSFFNSILYLILMQYYNSILIFFFLLLLHSIIMCIVIKQKINYFIIVYIIAFIISYITYLVALMISAALLLIVFALKIDCKHPISLITIPLIQFLLLKNIFKIKRFKYGFNFLKNFNNNVDVIKYIILLSVIILLIFCFLHRQPTRKITKYLVSSTIIIAISLLVWIKHEITKHYKKHMRDRTIEMQKKEIDEKIKRLEDLEQENYNLASVIHKYNRKIDSLEKALTRTIKANASTEFASELVPLLKETKGISQSFAEETMATQTLPKTNIFGIDNMLSYMADEAKEAKIRFDLNLNNSINDLIGTIISQDKFETLIGDHIKDAIIAVNASHNKIKSILVSIGIVDGCYEFSVYDTGIEFEIDTLLKLGLERITTHKDSGGSGIGFMTTFETMEETKASLIIEEYNIKTTNFTKSVSIRFDGKNEYRIYSYRAEDIKKRSKDKRIIIEKL